MQFTQEQGCYFHKEISLLQCFTFVTLVCGNEFHCTVSSFYYGNKLFYLMVYKYSHFGCSGHEQHLNFLPMIAAAMIATAEITATIRGTTTVATV